MPTVVELRLRLGKRGGSDDGYKAELEERQHTPDEQELKRVRTVMNSMADEYLCPEKEKKRKETLAQLGRGRRGPAPPQ